MLCLLIGALTNNMQMPSEVGLRDLLLDFGAPLYLQNGWSWGLQMFSVYIRHFVCMYVCMYVCLTTHNSGMCRAIVFNFRVAPGHLGDGFQHQKLGVVSREPENLHFLWCGWDG